MSFFRLLLAGAILLGATAASAQHAHQAHDTPPDVTLFPARDASGTAWLPDAAPMVAYRRPLGQWELMVHGAVFGQFLYEPGEQHRTGGFASAQASSVNWIMAAARRPFGRGRLGLRAMGSTEPWTVGDCGFINRLASGENCDGDTIHDRQHPHDVVMELAAAYDAPLGRGVRWQIYGGLAGEPALGPPAFPHRPSAAANPIAPITHHWLDSSHVTYGLVTAGVYDRRWKAEASLFNGREPDEQRADLDLAALDSVAGRVTFAPTARLVLQVSGAHLNDAEAEFPPLPRSDVARFTASAIYQRRTDETDWSASLAYGVNGAREFIPTGSVHLVTHAVLAEGSALVRDRHAYFGRIEVVGKPGEALHIHEAPAEVFTLGKLEAGYVRYFPSWGPVVSGVGVTGSLNLVPEALASRYQGRVSTGMGAFVTLRPSRHTM